LWFLLDLEQRGKSSYGKRKIELELGWQLFFGIQSIGEVDSSDSAVSMDLYSEGFYIVGTICSSSEIGQVELNLVPTFIESHGHGTNKRFDSGS